MKIAKKCLVILISMYIFNTYADLISDRKANKIEVLEEAIYFPDITFDDENMKGRSISEFEGKVVMVVFWATWCPHCIQELKSLDNLKHDFKKQNFNIIPLSQDYKGIAEVRKFYKKHDIKHLAIFRDHQNTLFKELNVSVLPTIFLIDEEGRIVMKISGDLRWQDDENRVMLLEYIKEWNKEIPKNTYKEDLRKFYGKQD